MSPGSAGVPLGLRAIIRELVLCRAVRRRAEGARPVLPGPAKMLLMGRIAPVSAGHVAVAVVLILRTELILKANAAHMPARVTLPDGAVIPVQDMAGQTRIMVIATAQGRATRLRTLAVGAW